MAAEGPVAEVLQLLGIEGRRSELLADAICLLVRKGAELGELERDAAIGIDGQWREIRRVPRQWLQRLAKAAQVGAFDRMDVKEVVDRILTEPPPAET